MASVDILLDTTDLGQRCKFLSPFSTCGNMEIEICRQADVKQWIYISENTLFTSLLDKSSDKNDMVEHHCFSFSKHKNAYFFH